MGVNTNYEMISVDVNDINDILIMIYGTDNILLKNVYDGALDIRRENIIVVN